jgi:hypothetical protein
MNEFNNELGNVIEGGINPMQHLTLATTFYMTELRRREQFEKYNLTEELYDAYLKNTNKDQLGVSIK